MSEEIDFGSIYDSVTEADAPTVDVSTPTTDEPVTVNTEGEAPTVDVDTTLDNIDKEIENSDQSNEEGEEQVQAVPAIDAPTSWSQEMIDKFGELPPETQEYIVQRDSEANAKISELGQQVKADEPLRELISTKQDTFDRHGLTPMQGFEKLLDVQDMLDNNPEGAIIAIAQGVGVDLYAMLGVQRQGQAPVNAQHRDLLIENRNLNNAAQRNEAAAKMQAERDGTVAQTEQKAHVSSWMSEQEHGTNEIVQLAMARYITNGKAQGTGDDLLKSAYDLVVEDMGLTYGTKKTDEQTKQDTAKSIATAKRNVRSNNVGKGGKKEAAKPAVAKKWDDDDALGAIYDKVNSA